LVCTEPSTPEKRRVASTLPVVGKNLGKILPMGTDKSSRNKLPKHIVGSETFLIPLGEGEKSKLLLL